MSLIIHFEPTQMLDIVHKKFSHVLTTYHTWKYKIVKSFSILATSPKTYCRIFNFHLIFLVYQFWIWKKNVMVNGPFLC
jgi:hypothetical protein